MTLALTYDILRREIGRFLRLGEAPVDWSDDDVTRVDDVIARGSRLVYFPEPAMIGEQALVGHNWSFTVDALSVTLTDATRYHDLPSDFQRLTSAPSIVGSDLPMEEVSEADLRHMANASSGSGFPQYYHVRRDVPSSEDLLFQIGVYPLPSGSSVVLEGEYLYSPAQASASQVPIIPDAHVEFYLAAMRFAADVLFNEPPDEKNEARYKELLTASLLFDSKIGGP